VIKIKRQQVLRIKRAATECSLFIYVSVPCRIKQGKELATTALAQYHSIYIISERV
jgi:hypothetical protein